MRLYPEETPEPKLMSMREIDRQYSVPSSHPDRQAEMRARAGEISIALQAGTKLELTELDWYIGYCRQTWFGAECWRNKSKQTIYKVSDLTLRVTDGMGMNDRGSPVWMYVTYRPVEAPGVAFSREANEFLTKFEPVYQATVWEPVNVSLPTFLGARVA